MDENNTSSLVLPVAAVGAVIVASVAAVFLNRKLRERRFKKELTEHFDKFCDDNGLNKYA